MDHSLNVRLLKTLNSHVGGAYAFKNQDIS